MSDELTVFDENHLRKEIISRWGEFGAHTDLFDEMRRELDRLRRANKVLMGLGERVRDSAFNETSPLIKHTAKKAIQSAQNIMKGE